MKRVTDILISVLTLIVLAPLMALIALLVCLDSGGPALYGQQRVGRHGAPFTLWKFRSMHKGSSQHVHQKASQEWFRGRPTGELKSESDPRITWLGRYLRRTNLDELPQLLNVVKGEMSLVGPRPTMPYERPLYEPWYFEREAVRPGITGLWQVSGRHHLSAPQMMELDVRYVRACSMWLDLRIMARTIPAIFEDMQSVGQRRVRALILEEVPCDKVQ